MQSTEPEMWRPVVGYEGFYEVSSYGNVRRVNATVRGPAGRLLKLRTNAGGYSIVFLSVHSAQKLHRVHRLVALAFLGEPEEPQLEVCHNDGVKTHNHVSNLRWDTHRNNMLDMVQHGAPWLAPKLMCKRGLHQLTPESTISNGERRMCRECHRAKRARLRLAKSVVELKWAREEGA